MEGTGRDVLKDSAFILGLLAVWIVGNAGTGLDRLTMKWAVNTSDVFSSFMFGAGHMGSQSVWDIDGDGINEIIFGTRRGHSRRLWCFDAYANFEWIYPPLNRDGLRGDPGKVSLVDVNKDGTCELCLAAGDGLHVLNGNGELLWVWDDPNLGAGIFGPPQACDVDGDGFMEFFVNDDWGFVHRIGHDGFTVWSVPSGSGSNNAQPTIADVDQDGEFELLFLGKDGKIHCLSARTGSERWQSDVGVKGVAQPVVVMDVNRDREYELIVWGDSTGDRPGLVVCASFWGSRIWSWDLPRIDQNVSNSIRFLQAFGDVDEDGSLDMVVMSSVGLYAIDIGGALPLEKWYVNLTGWSEEGVLPEGAVNGVSSCYQLIADVDGDGRQEVLVQAPYPIVMGGVTGEPKAYYLDEHVWFRRTAENGGWWGDVDEDGCSEWICELQGRTHYETQVYCLTLNGAFPAGSYWPEYYHSAHPLGTQVNQDWLLLKGAYSNSLWFPMAEVLLPCVTCLLCFGAMLSGVRPSCRST